jgi:hypothetical protein
MGRGWGTVSRAGEDATARLLAPAQPSTALAELKARILTQVSEQPRRLGDLVELAGSAARPSERLNLAEQAVWELLHEARVGLIEAGAVVDRAAWESILLDWRAWVEGEVSVSRG